ncbi:hypothetical protein [Halomicrococcus gelatinilyticus]|uniref:hypothetical protein n=1 Tax=Halomicrococcus gelatinilyticus TaxID=1702103 RepID=UPI002E15E812
MYEVRANTVKNRLYLTLDGKMDEDEASDAAEEAIAAVEELDPGFDIVNDMSGFQPVSQEAAERIGEAKEVMEANDVDTVVRVVGDSSIGKMQFDRVGETDYETLTAESVEEAESKL